MIYCISDLHGQFKQFNEMLELINFNEEDTLYVLGDVIDRGPESLKILENMMKRSNIHPLFGNHEYMMLSSIDFLMQEITEKSLKKMEDYQLDAIENWFNNGGEATFSEFIHYSKEKRNELLNYLGEFLLYEEVEVNGNQFVLTHGGIGNFSENTPLENYSLFDMVFTRPDYEKVYYQDKYLVTGHTPTPLIDESCKDGLIYIKNNHIAIDCGSVFGGRLGAVCLDTLETFYVK